MTKEKTKVQPSKVGGGDWCPALDEDCNSLPITHAECAEGSPPRFINGVIWECDPVHNCPYVNYGGDR